MILKDYIDRLNSLVEKHPKILNYPLIYQDDFLVCWRVDTPPRLVKFVDKLSNGDIHIVIPYNRESKSISVDECNAVLIN